MCSSYKLRTRYVVQEKILGVIGTERLSTTRDRLPQQEQVLEQGWEAPEDYHYHYWQSRWTERLESEELLELEPL